ncbi:MAG: nucleotidyltransferase domain-containing protein [Brevinematales bacterium]|nr:nucleotidyltransferase domain-containing protein [Brevinematales bacterium]
MVDYIEIAKEIRNEKYPDSDSVLLAGSIVRNEETKYSDLDIIVIYKCLQKAYRESFIYSGVLVETFVHDPETIDYFLEKYDKSSSSSALSQMIVEGIEIPYSTPLSREIKKKAHGYILAGPNELDEQTNNNMRYAITNLIDDIRDYKNKSELLGTLSYLYISLSEFYFKANGCWAGTDKYVSRLMKKYNADLENKVFDAFNTAIKDENIDKVIKITEDILKPFGGFLFDGYRFDATEEMRMRKQ